MQFDALPWDLSLFVLFNQTLRSGVLDFLAPLFSSAMLLFLLPAATAPLVWRRCGKGTALRILVILVAMGLSDLVSGQIKDVTLRVRPQHSVAGTWTLEGGTWRQLPADFTPVKRTGSSLPSAHAANTMALAVLTALFWRKARPWIFALPLLTGWSRLYLGKHFPMDVVAGWGLGLIVGLLAFAAWRRWLEPLANKADAGRPPGT